MSVLLIFTFSSGCALRDTGSGLVPLVDEAGAACCVNASEEFSGAGRSPASVVRAEIVPLASAAVSQLGLLTRWEAMGLCPLLSSVVLRPAASKELPVSLRGRPGESAGLEAEVAGVWKLGEVEE